MSDCPHTTVKCLCCGEEATPAHFMGKRAKTRTEASDAQRKAAAKMPRKGRKEAQRERMVKGGE